MAKEKISTWLRLKRAVLYRLAPYIRNDKTFLKMKWKLYMDYPLNLDNPQTFNEKIQWQKLHDRKPEYTKMVDKYEAKEYVAGVIGREHIIPTMWTPQYSLTSPPSLSYLLKYVLDSI